ncbi:MAG: DoxX family protein [Flavobacteriaceae bacterium]|nr:DoxX family protein [Muriicola sp.]NNC62690.1 DoxX family protein [Eudoraea sp.]NNL39993.1 DoxX family protein [Flavobacteriaceae bacterium]
MEIFIKVLQGIVGLSILNVWLIQYNKPTRWRGGDAKTILEEFKVYGLPAWFCYVVGTLKVILAIMLLAAIWYPELKLAAASGLALLLAGSISMHFRINDPIIKSFPASLFLAMCLIIIFYG